MANSQIDGLADNQMDVDVMKSFIPGFADEQLQINMTGDAGNRTNGLAWSHVFKLLDLDLNTFCALEPTLLSHLEEAYDKVVKNASFNTTAVLANIASVVSKRQSNCGDYEEEGDEDKFASRDYKFTIYMATLTAILISGLIGNSLQLVLMSHKSLTNLSYSVYLRCLAVVDTIVLMLVVAEDYLDAFEILDIFFTKSVHLCQFWHWITLSTRHISPWLVLALTIERFIAATFPLQRSAICTFKTASIVSASIIAVFLIQPLVVTVPWIRLVASPDPMDPGGCEIVDEAVARFLQYDITFIMTFLPCLLMFIFNILIIIALRRAYQSRQQMKGDSSKATSKGTPSPDKTTVSLLVVSSMAFVTLAPKAIFEAIEYFTIGYAGVEYYLYLWRAFNCIELLNFAQNFYMMMITGNTFRSIMKEQLTTTVSRMMRTHSTR